MKKVRIGQNFRFGFFDVSPQQRMSAIKDAGFDSTMFWWGTEFECTDGNRLHLFDLAQKNGLEVVTCHFPSTNAHWLWMDGEEGELFVKQFDQACKECGERGIQHLVLHTTRKLITPEPNEIGLENFRRMLDSAKKYNVVIALENTRFLRYNDYIVNHFSDETIGFCFDSGHANCYTPNEQPLQQFGSMLVTTHLHDNLGPHGYDPDQHHLIGEGNVDFDKIFAELKHFGCQNYNLESYCNESSCYFGKLNAEEFLRLSYQKVAALIKKSGV